MEIKKKTMVQSPLSNNASNVFSSMSDQFLIDTYVPNDMRIDIYDIDYNQLKKAGYKLISFDIDETIAGDNDPDPSKRTVELFDRLKSDGFKVILVTNANEERAKHFSEWLHVDYSYDSGKPLMNCFNAIMNKYGVTKSEMVHIGNSFLDDIAGGNQFGITTILVRNVSGSDIKDCEKPLVFELNKRNLL